MALSFFLAYFNPCWKGIINGSDIKLMESKLLLRPYVTAKKLLHNQRWNQLFWDTLYNLKVKATKWFWHINLTYCTIRSRNISHNNVKYIALQKVSRYGTCMLYQKRACFQITSWILKVQYSKDKFILILSFEK